MDDVVVVLNDVLSGQVVIDGLLNKLLIDLLLSFVLHDLLHVLHDIRELLKNTLEGLSIILESRHIGFSHKVLFDESLLKDALIINHLTCFQEPLGRLIAHNTVHDEVHILYSVSNLRDNIALDKSFRLQLFKILRVKVVISVLEESVDCDGILIKEFGQLGF